MIGKTWFLMALVWNTFREFVKGFLFAFGVLFVLLAVFVTLVVVTLI